MWGVRGDPRLAPGLPPRWCWCSWVTVGAVWVANPFAAALLLPALHAWLFVAAPEVRIRRGAALGVVALTLLPGAVLALYYMIALGYSPPSLVWTCCCSRSAEAPGSRPSWSWCLLLGCLVCVVSVIRSQGLYGDEAPPEAKPSIRGPDQVRRAPARSAGPSRPCGGECPSRRPRACVRRCARCPPCSSSQGALLLADAGLTLVWQEPISAVYAQFKQGQLARSARRAREPDRSRSAARSQRLRTESRRVAFLARLAAPPAESGDAARADPDPADRRSTSWS